ncbi:phosphatase PAP2 family protein [Leucobacter luti]|uniref:Undecaprenyl-diphosphatase n=1 Tax=Leucobacter luti TaxID=340320 RepID=A0A4Q7TYK0_9MICO|nr:phosphatase PAP2 family protein [Leucobacter luti]MBL3698708.1 phosphatase PAP2 family protein [Leucobacter luti]RZT66083.1 undecaprenyl-diphosphatase [Leucobacter luti]
MTRSSAVLPATRVAAGVRAATPWAIVGVAVVVAAGLALRFVVGGPMGPIGPDEWWHGIASVTRGSLPYAIAVFCAEIGGGVGAAATAAIAVALLIVLRRPRDAAAVATAMLLGVAASEALKALVLRPRPWDQLYVSSGSSFPSGHSLGAAALAVSVILVVAAANRMPRTAVTWATVLGIAWILLMMWSRTALHVHWFTDVVAGALLGASIAVLSRRFWFRDRAAAAPRTRAPRPRRR